MTSNQATQNQPVRELIPDYLKKSAFIGICLGIVGAVVMANYNNSERDLARQETLGKLVAGSHRECLKVASRAQCDAATLTTARELGLGSRVAADIGLDPRSSAQN